MLRSAFPRSLRALAAGAAIWATSAVAQPPGGNSGFNLDVGELLQRFDRNRDGWIEPGEAEGPYRTLLERVAKEKNLNLQQGIRTNQLYYLLREVMTGKSTNELLGIGTGSADGIPQLVPGFGTDDDGAPLPSLAFGSADADSWESLKQKYDMRVIDRVDENMFRYDRDRDGLLDREEVRRADFSGNPYDFDRNRDGKLSRSEVAERYKSRYAQERSDRSRSESNNNSSSSSSGSSSNSSSGGSSNSSSSGKSDDRVLQYAEGLLKQYDANRDGVLQKSEWANMRGEPQRADRDNNGQITKEELARHLADYGRSRDSSSGKTSATPVVERRSERFISPKERLPTDLPSWFGEKDSDADGQVAMAEYSTTWNDSRAREFAGWDLNGDGLITVAECRKKQATLDEEKSSKSRR